MKMLETTKWDLAEHISTEQDVLGILEAALEENDTALLLSVLSDLARSKGISQIAENTNLACESLYRSLSPESNPSFNTVAKVLYEMGFQLAIKPRPPA
jgi:probable addiction module antidote protein